MSGYVISCRTIENELRRVMEECSCNWPVMWLESGLHNVPRKLNARIQEYLDDCRDCDTVLLALSLCGNSVVGLRTHDFQLVMPRSDDCISLLLGDVPRPFATLFLTEGWLKGGQHLGQEYDQCMQKYGKKRGERIFDAMLGNYRYLAMLDTGCFDKSVAEPEIRSIAEKLGLEYTTITGSLTLLTKLLRREWDETEFIRIPPHSTLTYADCTPKGESHEA